MKITKFTTLFLVAGFILSLGLLTARPQHSVGLGGSLRYFSQQLTGAQRVELHALIQDLNEQGLSREDIHEQVKNKVAEWGIEHAAPSKHGRGPLGKALGLSEEQQEILKALHESLKAEGADHQAVHEAVKTQLESWGITMPSRPEGFGRDKHRRPGFQMNLTEDQRNELNALREEMRTHGATREEIRSAIKEKLESWDIRAPQEKSESSEALDKQHRYGQVNNSPNPFNPSTTIAYTVKESGQVNITIYNMQGQRIRTLLNASKPAGSFEITWDGMNDSGNTVPSGTYICKIASSTGTISKRMQMLK